MKNCTACNQPIALNVKFCPECGAKQEVDKVAEIKEFLEVEAQQPVENFQQYETTTVITAEKQRLPTVYKILCILSFIGPVHVVLIGLFYLIFGAALKDISLLIIGVLWSASSVGTGIGAIMLLKKLNKGLFVYTLNQVVYVSTAIYVAIITIISPKTEGLGGLIFVFLVTPSLIFLGIFWYSKLRTHLR